MESIGLVMLLIFVSILTGIVDHGQTRLPVLAGAAKGLGATGAMGAAYPPYIKMDAIIHIYY